MFVREILVAMACWGAAALPAHAVTTKPAHAATAGEGLRLHDTMTSPRSWAALSAQPARITSDHAEQQNLAMADRALMLASVVAIGFLLRRRTPD